MLLMHSSIATLEKIIKIMITNISMLVNDCNQDGVHDERTMVIDDDHGDKAMYSRRVSNVSILAQTPTIIGRTGRKS